MNAFITGINGFVGKHLSNFLLSKGFSVSGMDITEAFDDKIKYYKCDILNPDAINKVITDSKPDFIFHLAGFTSVKKSFEQPELCTKLNVEGTRNLLDAVINAGINPKILVISSAEIYGIPKSVPISEDSAINTISPYGESKKEQEKACLEYYEKHGLNIIISRSFSHIGPGQEPTFVVSDFAKQIADIERKNREPVIKVGNLEVKRDLTDVRDIVKAYLIAVEKCKPGEVYNICSANSYSIREILDKLLSFAKIKIEIKQEHLRMRPNDIPVLEGDNNKFMSLTGWSPKIPIEKTLQDILNYWREKN